MRPEPKPTVAAWISDRDAEELYLTAVSEAELLYGVAIMPTGRRRNALKAAMSRWLDLGFADRILPFDSSAARAYAVIASRRRHAGSWRGGPSCRESDYSGRRPLDCLPAPLLDARPHLVPPFPHALLVSIEPRSDHPIGHPVPRPSRNPFSCTAGARQFCETYASARSSQ